MVDCVTTQVGVNIFAIFIVIENVGSSHQKIITTNVPETYYFYEFICSSNNIGIDTTMPVYVRKSILSFYILTHIDFIGSVRFVSNPRNIFPFLLNPLTSFFDETNILSLTPPEKYTSKKVLANTNITFSNVQ